MQTLEEHLIDLVLREEVTLEDALRNANDPDYIINDIKTRRNFFVE
jgi:Tfp pilus assembly ATPase PilU